MRLRPYGPVVAFVAIAGLAAGGLAWVTVAALGVEAAQRDAAAQADQANNIRVALWRLDGTVLLPLAYEDGRPFDHYEAGSPLLAAPLPEWVRLHFQIDPAGGWESPQVPAADAVPHLRAAGVDLPPAGLMADRTAVLADLRRHFVPKDVAAVLAAREPTAPALWSAPFAVSAVLPAAIPDPPPPAADPPPAQQPSPPQAAAIPSPEAAARPPVPPRVSGLPLPPPTQQAVTPQPIEQQQALSLGNNAPNYRINSRANSTQNGEFVNRAQIVSRGMNELKGAYNISNGGNSYTTNTAGLTSNLGGGVTFPPPAGGPAAGTNGSIPPVIGGTFGTTLTPPPPAQPVPVAVHLGAMRPQWLRADDGADRLVVARSAKLPDRVVYQGVVLDWDRLQVVLKDVVRDLFPDATLVPVRDPAGVTPERAMTALPVQLDPGPPTAPPPPGWTPLRLGLALAWAAAVTALLAAGLGGWSLADLSARRVRFVSAVTHELRTPLTSLRLYLDLLTSGMVADDAKKNEYLGTLNTEAERLHRLIDNVLDFARLENRPRPAARQSVAASSLLERVRETWHARCAADGRELLTISTLPPGCDVRTDPELFGQVIGNLIENARKYARDAADGRIWVWAKPGRRGRVVFEVEDRGPGVPAHERGRVFRPFRRGLEADRTSGGAGLGLALARRWATALGGRLSYRPADGGVGACFRLELPASS